MERFGHREQAGVEVLRHLLRALLGSEQAVLGGMERGHQRSDRRQRPGRGRDRGGEDDAFGGQAVECGVGVRRPQRAQRVGAQRVDQHQHDVRATGAATDRCRRSPTPRARPACESARRNGAARAATTRHYRSRIAPQLQSGDPPWTSRSPARSGTSCASSTPSSRRRSSRSRSRTSRLPERARDGVDIISYIQGLD